MNKNLQKSKKAIVKKSVKNDVKKTPKLVPKHVELKGFLSFFILHELGKNDRSGDELAAVIGERKGSNLTPGTIYPALKRLRRQKLIQYKRNGRKKVYSLTVLGSKELKALYVLFDDMFYGLKSRLKR
ncbi:MAG: PadR family transcriptional regulator [Candidatus Woesearchaeota archaeon]